MIFRRLAENPQSGVGSKIYFKERHMASSKEFLTYVLEQLSGLDGISYRAMMGEYVLYYCGKIVGGIYDNRLLVKPVGAAVDLMPDTPLEFPYDGAKEMLPVYGIDNKEFLVKLFNVMYDELPMPKRHKTASAKST